MINVYSFGQIIGRFFVLLLVFTFFGIGQYAYAANQEKSMEMTAEKTTVDSDSSAQKGFAYNPVGKRDPFEPLVNQFRQLGGGSEKVKGPLEKFELGQFRLLAMLLGKGTPHAMVKAPDGKSYIVKPGDKIGKLDGKIVRIETKVVDPVSRSIISPDRIVIKEIGFDPYTNKQVVEYRYITM